MKLVRTALHLLACTSLLQPPVAAQGSDGLSDDVAVLLALKAHGDNAQADGLRSWVTGVDLCSRQDPDFSAWSYVMCCTVCTVQCGSTALSHSPWNPDRYPTGVNTRVFCDGYRDGSDGSSNPEMTNVHRVTGLDLQPVQGIGGDLTLFAGLSQLRFLRIGEGFSGDVVSLAGLTELRYLDINSEGLHSDVSLLGRLTGLRYLGIGAGLYGDVVSLSGLTELQRLDVKSCGGCYGNATALLAAIPALAPGRATNRYSYQEGLVGEFCPSAERAEYLAATYCPLSIVPHFFSNVSRAPDRTLVMLDGHSYNSLYYQDMIDFRPTWTYLGSNPCACCTGPQKLLVSGGECHSREECISECVDPGAWF